MTDIPIENEMKTVQDVKDTLHLCLNQLGVYDMLDSMIVETIWMGIPLVSSKRDTFSDDLIWVFSDKRISPVFLGKELKKWIETGFYRKDESRMFIIHDNKDDPPLVEYKYQISRMRISREDDKCIVIELLAKSPEFL